MTPPAAARAARTAVTAIFLLNGVLFGSWAARIPAVRDRLELSDGELGLALAFIAVGAIAAMPVAGLAAARIGSRRATRTAFALTSATTAALPFAPSLPVLCLLTLAFGASMGSLDVTMNAHGVAVEGRYGRPILSGFHAAFSLGGLLGAALGAAAAGTDLDVRAHLTIAGLASATVGLAWSRRFLPGSEDANGASEPLLVRPPRRLWALGALAFACLLVEGASADWSGVYLKDELGTSPGTAALAFTAFSVTMTLGRLLGDRLVARFGPVALVRGGGILAGAGFGLALLAADPVAALVGFASLGAGMSPIVPIVFRAAGGVDGMAPGVALAAVSSTGYLGFLVGPPVIGGVAELVGLPIALALLVLLSAAIASLAVTTRARTPLRAGAAAEAAVA
jgi:predicted MFS family arabinose efflux permease